MSNGDARGPADGAPLGLSPAASGDASVRRRPAPAGRPRWRATERTEDASLVVDCAVYVDGMRQPPVPLDDSLDVARAKGGFVWLGLFAPSEPELNAIADRFNLHPLAVEDAVYAHERPKLDHYDQSMFMVLKTATYVEHERLTATSEVVDTGEVMVFLGRDYVITVRHGEHTGLTDLRARLESQRDLLALGPSAVLYAVADLVVDTYVDVASDVEDDVDELSASVFSQQRNADDVNRIYQLKRELLQLRRAVAPLEVPLLKLAERPIDLIAAELRPYFRDVLDNELRVRDQVIGLDDLLTSILQASLARISQTDNEDTRKISAYAALIAVPTLVTGVYGMNFSYMPELTWHYGYFACLLFIVVVCVLLYRGFKRSGWL